MDKSRAGYLQSSAFSPFASARDILSSSGALDFTSSGTALSGDRRVSDVWREDVLVIDVGDDTTADSNEVGLGDGTAQPARSTAPPSPGAAPQGSQLRRSEADMSQLQEELLDTKFPFIEDEQGQDVGEGTWTNFSETIIARFKSHKIQRRNKEKAGTAVGFVCAPWAPHA
ncbi:unnamed protein product [Ectocarpus sp. 4 AP-2014]